MKFLVLLLTLFTLNAPANNILFGPPVAGTATVTSTQVMAKNSLRTYLIILNTGSNSMYVKFGSAQSGTEGILIPAGWNYEPDLAPSNSVWVVTASSTTSYTIMQGQ